MSACLLATLLAACTSNERSQPATSAAASTAASPSTTTTEAIDPVPDGSSDESVAGTDDVDAVADGTIGGDATRPTIDEWIADSAERSAEELLGAFSAVFGEVPGIDPLALAEDDSIGTRTSLVPTC